MFKQKILPLKQHFSQIRILQEKLIEAVQESDFNKAGRLNEQTQQTIREINEYGRWQIDKIDFKTKDHFFGKYHLTCFKKDSQQYYLNKLHWSEFIGKKWLCHLPDGNYIAIWHGQGVFSKETNSNIRYWWEIKTTPQGKRFVVEHQNSTDEKRCFEFDKTPTKTWVLN